MATEKYEYRSKLFVLLGASLLCGGCATLTTSSSQTVTVQTDPPGAICQFMRDRAVVGIVNPTPGTLLVSKSRLDMTIRCDKDGYLEATGAVGSRFQAMTFGNILFGGLVGVVVDASSGAMNKYEPQITITLIPAVFATVAERDQFFDQRASQFSAEAGKVKQRIRDKCQPENCERELKLADEEEAAGLARIKHQRETAKIKSQAPIDASQPEEKAVVGAEPSTN